MDERLIAIIKQLVDALVRRGGELDGNWGYPHYQDELREISMKLDKLVNEIRGAKK